MTDTGPLTHALREYLIPCINNNNFHCSPMLQVFERWLRIKANLYAVYLIAITLHLKLWMLRKSAGKSPKTRKFHVFSCTIKALISSEQRSGIYTRIYTYIWRKRGTRYLQLLINGFASAAYRTARIGIVFVLVTSALGKIRKLKFTCNWNI